MIIAIFEFSQPTLFETSYTNQLSLVCCQQKHNIKSKMARVGILGAISVWSLVINHWETCDVHFIGKNSNTNPLSISWQFTAILLLFLRNLYRGCPRYSLQTRGIAECFVPVAAHLSPRGSAMGLKSLLCAVHILC